MACRNLKLAEVARAKLFALLDAHIMRLKGIPGYDGHADAFRRNVKIDIHFIDLAVVDSIFEFTNKVCVKCVDVRLYIFPFLISFLAMMAQIPLHLTLDLQRRSRQFF